MNTFASLLVPLRMHSAWIKRECRESRQQFPLL